MQTLINQTPHSTLSDMCLNCLPKFYFWDDRHYKVLVFFFFSPFSIAITALGEERANLSAFLYVCSICACLVLSVSSSSWCLGRVAVCDCGTPGIFFFFLSFFLFFFFFFFETWVCRGIHYHENFQTFVLLKSISFCFIIFFHLFY